MPKRTLATALPLAAVIVFAPVATPAAHAWSSCRLGQGITRTCTYDPQVTQTVGRDKAGRRVVTRSQFDRVSVVSQSRRTDTYTTTVKRTVGATTTTTKTRQVTTRTVSAKARAFDSRTVARQVLDLTNAQRRKAGLKPFTTHTRLTDAARAWSTTMARTGRYEHRSDWSWMRGVPRCTSAAENIHHLGAGESFDLAALAVDDWMYSRGHRANILDPELTRIGIGVVKAGDGSYYLTQNFCS